MHGSHIPPRKRFLAVYAMTNGKRGASACTLAHGQRMQWSSAYCLLECIRAMTAEPGCLRHAFRGA